MKNLNFLLCCVEMGDQCRLSIGYETGFTKMIFCVLLERQIKKYEMVHEKGEACKLLY